MKKIINSLLIAAIVFLSVILVASCDLGDNNDIWESATYTEDTELGSGAVTVMVEVVANDRSVTFTIKTDKSILGDVLLEHGLIAGEEGEFGLYIKEVNGMTADFDVDRSYWAFYKNGEYMLSGVDLTEFSDGDHYELVYTK